MSVAEDYSYDRVPYEDKPYAYSHVRHLETIATLCGLEPPDIATSRVLELGCAGGGNLLPQAEELPDARFVGIDLSQVQIDQGQQLIADAGLKNVELKKADIQEIDRDWGQFDYIICHGVYSWVPAEVRDKILAVCRDNLAVNGVAYISYNVYPGWHFRGLVRDVMLYHVAQLKDPKEQIAQAKAILRFMADVNPGEGAFGKMLREEVKLLSGANASYLFHDHLETVNSPCYFHEFIEEARQKDLAFLCESQYGSMRVDQFGEKISALLAKVPILQQQQYLDFLRNRSFRMTLLCHEHVKPSLQIRVDRLQKFSVRLQQRIPSQEEITQEDGTVEYEVAGGKLRTNSPLLKASMEHLREITPRYAPLDEVHQNAVAEEARSDKSIRSLAQAVFRAYGIGLVDIKLHPPSYAVKLSKKPLATPLRRAQAKAGSLVTNFFHNSISLDELGRFVLQRVDGTQTTEELASQLQQAVKQGDLKVLINQEESGELQPDLAAQVVTQALTKCLRVNLLSP